MSKAWGVKSFSYDNTQNEYKCTSCKNHRPSNIVAVESMKVSVAESKAYICFITYGGGTTADLKKMLKI